MNPVRNLSISSGRAAVDEVLLVRVAGLSRDALRGFHHSRVDQVLAEETEALRLLDESIEQAGTALFQDIGAHTGHERTVLVTARRGVHHGDLPRRVAREAVPLMSERATAAFGSWTAARDRVRSLGVQLEARWAAAEADDLRHLRDICLDRRFRTGLEATSRELADIAQRWAVGTTGAPQRKRLLRLARMAARAAAKTSPFSSWMVTIPARWGRAGGEAALERLLIELDGTVIGALTRALHTALPAPAELEVRVNPSLVRVDGGWLFLRSGRREQTVRVTEHPAIDAVLRTLRPGEAEAGLAARVAGGAALVSKCLAAGLIEHRLPVADHHPRPWAAWSTFADRRGAASLSAELTALDTALDDSSAAAEAAAERVGRRLGIELPAVKAHEMSVAADWPYELPDRPDDAVLDELDCARRLLALYDHKLPAKAAAGEYLAERFGAGFDVPLTVALDSLGRARLDSAGDLGRIIGPTVPPWGADLATCSSSMVRELGRALSGLTGEVLDRAAHGPLAVADLDRLLDDFPFAHPNRSATFYLQQATEAGIHRVVNVVHGGHGRGRGRLAAQAGLAIADLVPTIDEDVVEISGSLGSALNTRTATAPRELQYPGTTSGRPDGERLPMSSVRVVPGPDGLPVLRDTDGRDVRLVHLGMAADLALPPFVRLLEQVFGSAYLIHPSIAVFTPAAPGLAGTARSIATPRVVLGATALQRTRRLLRREEFPGGRGPRESLRAWHRWLASHGLGSRFYLRAWSSADHGGGQSKARKPVFVDVTSPLLFADAQKMLRQAEYAIVEECLPDPLAGSGHVTEFAVQVGARR
ncbi:hypothetical protein NX801_10555 [Streptomyces sp. LP05-1]|uniref:Lantibiotic dehydratase N-terminal domain-containing protein n=1 Tax=Streptomyces pyxinae TaxID=2970734 RepID=A0ABT2CFB4_9ACTN|nr:hypothetical protein [Streptomyces sp. LP05-1]MCS0636095.1 hypothetical protein [Streptomyces sp. LP05-1]